MKKIGCFMLILLCIAGIAFSQSGGKLAIRIALLKWDGSAYDSVPFTRTVNLQAGDTFQIAVEADSTAYCYIISESTSGETALLAKAVLKRGSTLFLPAEDSNFSISPPAGTDMIHIIVADAKQKQLETLLANIAPGTVISQFMPLKDEIMRLKQSLSAIAEAPEKPAAMGGVRRSLSEKNSYEFSGQKLYVKTISIRHE